MCIVSFTYVWCDDNNIKLTRICINFFHTHRFSAYLKIRLLISLTCLVNRILSRRFGASFHCQLNTPVRNRSLAYSIFYELSTGPRETSIVIRTVEKFFHLYRFNHPFPYAIQWVLEHFKIYSELTFRLCLREIFDFSGWGRGKHVPNIRLIGSKWKRLERFPRYLFRWAVNGSTNASVGFQF